MTGPSDLSEFGATLLQAVVTLGLAALLFHLYRRHRKSHFRWWAIAFALRALSVGAIALFVASGAEWLLFVHQVLIAWTALGLLYAAQVFSRQLAWRRWYLLLLAFPVAWAYIAIFVLDDFALAAGPAVGFLALATGWAGVVFWRYRQRTHSAAAGMLAVVMLLWATHHLDYLVWRALGAASPWGHYMDILLVVAMGAGILLLVVEEQREGLLTLMALSGDGQGELTGDFRSALLGRPLELRGVRGAALLSARADGGLVVERGVGACSGWADGAVPARVESLARDALRLGRSRLEGPPRPTADAPPFTAVLPLGTMSGAPMVLVIVGDIAAPFAALDNRILGVVGAQVGSAMERTELTTRLAQRTEDLERLSVRLLRDHEEQRRRLGRELHDETAQVFSALKLQLGSLREGAPAALRDRFDDLLAWVDRGATSVRRATEGLRPSVLDDLGLLPALRALVSDAEEWCGVGISFTTDTTPGDLKRLLGPEAEVALFRALQESLSNVARHAGASAVDVRLAVVDAHVRLTVSDDGVGIDPGVRDHIVAGSGRTGLFGMRERLAGAGGAVRFRASVPRGLTVEAEVPLAAEHP
ncbi:MAG: ATP-binding protein [Gemmatimonadaceae bacterium]